MRKSILLGTILASLTLSVSMSASAATKSEGSWKQFPFSAETCVHNNRVTPMYTLNGEMRKTECFTLFSKVTENGKRIYQNVSRDGTVVIPSRKLG